MRPDRPDRLVRLIALAGALSVGVAAAGNAPGSGPAAVYTSVDPVRDPTLLADSTGTVHLFFLTRRNPTLKLPDTLMYARRSGDGWSAPTIVLSVPDGQPLSAPSLALDAHGFLHVAYSGRGGLLQYRRAHLSRILEEEWWTPPSTLTERGVLGSAIVPSGERTLHLVYADRGGDVYSLRSDDGGRNWSDPLRVSAVEAGREATDLPRLAVDGRGRLHLVWTQYRLPSGWPPMGSYYSRSLDGGTTWSPPRQLSGERYGTANVVARGDGEVHVVWNSLASVGERVHTWSADGGDTWSAPQVVTARVRGGWTGMPGLQFDAAGRLHLVTSVDGPENVERIFHLVWDGGAWSDPELLSGGTEAIDSVEFPTLAIGDGNRLYVAYEVDYRQIVSADRTVEAPALPPHPVPTLATDLWSRAVETSVPFRIYAAVLVALALELTVRGVRRAAHRGGA